MAMITGLVTLLGVGLALGSLVFLHLRDTEVSPVRDPVSAYGVGRYRRGFQVEVLALGVAGAAAAAGLLEAVHPPPLPLVLALLVFTATRVLIAWFPTDRAGSLPTWTGRVHQALALVAFAAIAVAAILFDGSVGQVASWSEVRRVTAWIWVVGGGTALILLLTSWLGLRPLFGLAERVYYALMLGWLAILGFALLSLQSPSMSGLWG